MEVSSSKQVTLTVNPPRKKIPRSPYANPPSSDLDLRRLRNRRISIATSSDQGSIISKSLPPLLRVPVEIRREIFKYLLPSPEKKFQLYQNCEAAQVANKWNKQRSLRPDTYSLAILRTNHQIFYDTMPLLYSENLFHIISMNYLQVLDFVRQLSPEAKSLVRKVRVTFLPDRQTKYPGNHDLFCSVIHDQLPGLTTLSADPCVWI